MYKCEIPDCEKIVKIRTTIKNKDSEFFGKKVCPYHASQFNKKSEISDKTKRTKRIRAEIRKDYPDFFKKHIELAKEMKCEECGESLKGNVSEICHIVGKSDQGGNPEIATNDLNILYLCGVYSKNQCHKKFDSSLSNREKMFVFPKALENFKLFKNKITKKNSEVLHYFKFLI